MSLKKRFGTDREKEIAGRWFEINEPNEDGTLPAFLLARRSTNNTAYAAAMSRVIREQGDDIQQGNLSVEEDKTVLREVFVDTILKGWRNVYQEDEFGNQGKQPISVAYSRENALQLFEALPDLYSTLMANAAKLSNYQDKQAKTAAKK